MFAKESLDVDDFTIGRLLERSVARFPDKEALVFKDVRQTYAQLDRQANALALKLVELGVGKGDTVAINIPNWIEFVWSFVAATRVGAVAVPLSTRYREQEITHILRDSCAKVLITVSSFNRFDYLPLIESIRPDLSDLHHVIALGAGGGPDVLPLESILTGEEPLPSPSPFAEVSGSDTAAILYTSGTTGKPKGVMLSHHNLVGNAVSVSSEVLDITHEDVLLLFIPLSHSGGITTLLWGFATGAKVVLVDIFKPEEVLETIARERVSVIHGVPTAWIKLAEVAEANGFDLSTLRLGVMGAAPCPVEAVREVSEKLKFDLRIAYGLTETAPLLAMTRADDSPEQRVSTVGRALPGVELKVVDDKGREVAPGEVGELLCRGYNVMKGYYRSPQHTAEVLDAEGWLHTGDLGTIDEEGYVRIIGRKKEMIIRGGFKIYPQEVEEFLFTHPGIQNAAVVGIPQPVYGESVWAFVVPKNGVVLSPEEVIEFCREKIANFKAPEQVRIVKDLPMTGSGKVRKFELQEAALKDMSEKS